VLAQEIGVTNCLGIGFRNGYLVIRTKLPSFIIAAGAPRSGPASAPSSSA